MTIWLAYMNMDACWWRTSIPPITAEEFDRALTERRGFVVYLWAPWDKEGQVFDTWFDEFRLAVADSLTVHSADADSATGLEMCARFQFVTTPTLLFFLGGALVGRLDRPRNRVETQSRLRAWREASSGRGDLPSTHQPG